MKALNGPGKAGDANNNKDLFLFLVAESNSLDLFPFHGWFLAINIYRSPLN